MFDVRGRNTSDYEEPLKEAPPGGLLAGHFLAVDVESEQSLARNEDSTIAAKQVQVQIPSCLIGCYCENMKNNRVLTAPAPAGQNAESDHNCRPMSVQQVEPPTAQQPTSTRKVIRQVCITQEGEISGTADDSSFCYCDHHHDDLNDSIHLTRKRFRRKINALRYAYASTSSWEGLDQLLLEDGAVALESPSFSLPKSLGRQQEKYSPRGAMAA